MSALASEQKTQERSFAERRSDGMSELSRHFAEAKDMESAIKTKNPQKVGSERFSSKARLQANRKPERDLLRRGGATE